MKKSYSLDYSIERDVDRLHAIEDILDKLPTTPTPNELEQMASYILYGKDEEGKNAVQRGETTDGDKRYKSFARTEDKNLSLDEILDNPLADQTNLRPATERYIYTKKKTDIIRPKGDDPGDSIIPGMQQLWDRIDYLEHVVAVNEGRAPADPSVTILRDNYRLYQLKHMLIDLRREQYYLKDSWNPPIHFLAVTPPKPQTYNWDQDTAYWLTEEQWRAKLAASYYPYDRDISHYKTKVDSDGTTWVWWVVRRHHFDWENPVYIHALIDHYSNIYMQVYDKMDSWGRTLIYDFDRYFDMCHFSPLREYVLTLRIDRMTCAQIAVAVKEKFGIDYTENYISTILAKEIPRTMAAVVKKHRLLLETPPQHRKACPRCGRILPLDPLFFGRNKNRKTGYASACKDCEKLRRIRGGQSVNDRRSKDSAVYEVPQGETRN